MGFLQSIVLGSCSFLLGMVFVCQVVSRHFSSSCLAVQMNGVG
jgi:hypothetical protein